jgi:ABC-type nitrate/sulfonate/bicarbonate transport system permease component
VALTLTAPGRRGRASALGRWLPALGLVILLLVVWEAAVAVFDVAPYLLPAPSRVWTAFTDLWPDLLADLTTTVTTALLGLALALVVGVALALLIATVTWVRRALYPLLVVSQAIPMIVLAPVLIVWLGFGQTPRVLVVALVAFFPIVVSTVDGLERAEAEQVDLVRSMGGTRWTVLRHVRLPGAVPAVFAGLQIAATYAMVGAVIAEWMGASSGIGLLLTRSQASFRMDQVFVGVALIALVSVALFMAARGLSRVAVPWTRVEDR